MEYFVPEQEFEKADFKGTRISPPHPRETSLSAKESKPSAKITKPSQRRTPPASSVSPPSARSIRSGQDITEIMGLNKPSAKADEPEARSYRVRDANGKIVSDASRKQALPSHTKPAQKKPFSLPKPQTPREARKIALQETHMPTAFQPARLSRDEIQKSRQSATPVSQSGAPVSKELGILGEAVLLNLAGARHVLRRWYWEKSGQADPAIAFVPPHERIHIALKLCGMNVLQKLFSTMSPTERKQMVEILKKPLNVPASYPAAVQAAFMQAMSEQQSWT